MKKMLLLVILLVLSIVATTTGLYLAHLFDINIWGNVNVEEPTIIESDIELNIDREVGSKIYELGVVNIPKNISMQIKGELRDYKGDIKLVLNGILELKSKEKIYRINMPCLININEPCYRVAMIIPGYDAPLTVVSARYNVTLTLSWKASGKGSFYLKLVGSYSEGSLT
ncbi:MAG: hypothetical protein QW775_06280 [Ignisphaera sp.]|uniref:Uncharacterized protein n=1 Tax=Ignisphaera aggregans TaxID=334771 RepID=A0A7C4NKJ0_9CREN